MKRVSNLLVLLLIMSSTVMAQGTKSFTLEDLMPGGSNYYNLMPENKYGLSWWNDIVVEGEMDELKTMDPKTGKENVLITRDEINQILNAKNLGIVRSMYDATFPYSEKLLMVTTPNRVLIDLDKKEVVWSQPRVERAANMDWSKESRHLAYTVDNNLFVLTATGEQQQVTNEPQGIVCGQSVHRNELYDDTYCHLGS